MGHLHLHIAAKELQRRKHQEPRCQPVAFAPILASFRLTTEREQNEAEGESKAAGSKAHARNGTEVAVLPWRHRASHEGLQGCGAIIWCVHRDASCQLRCRLSGIYQSDIIGMADRQERHSPSGSAQTTNECPSQAPAGIFRHFTQREVIFKALSEAHHVMRFQDFDTLLSIMATKQPRTSFQSLNGVSEKHNQSGF